MKSVVRAVRYNSKLITFGIWTYFGPVIGVFIIVFISKHFREPSINRKHKISIFPLFCIYKVRYLNRFFKLVGLYKWETLKVKLPVFLSVTLIDIRSIAILMDWTTMLSFSREYLFWSSVRFCNNVCCRLLPTPWLVDRLLPTFFW